LLDDEQNSAHEKSLAMFARQQENTISKREAAKKKRRGPVQQAPPESCSNAWKLRSSEGEFQPILQLAVGLGDDSRSEPGVGTAGLQAITIGANDVI